MSLEEEGVASVQGTMLQNHKIILYRLEKCSRPGLFVFCRHTATQMTCIDLLGQQGYPRPIKVLNYTFTWSADISLTKMNYIQLHRDYHLPEAISSILKRKRKSRKL